MHFIPTSQTQLDRIKAKEMGYVDYHHAIHCASQTALQRSAATSNAEDSRVIDVAIANLQGLLAGDAAVDMGNKRIRAAMDEFQGLRVAGLLAKAWFAENPSGLFKDSVNDFNILRGDDFPPRVANDSTSQLEQGYRLLSTLMSEQHSSAYHTLYSYAFMKVFASYAAGLAQMARTGAPYTVTNKLLSVMQFLLERRDVDEALDFVHGPADELMPRDMNINASTGALDTEHSSTWWSRIQSMVMIEMAGVCSVLPYDMLKEHLLNNGSARPPFTALYVPALPTLRESYIHAAKARWLALVQ